MKISENFSLKEFEYSLIAEKNKIDNRIPEKIIPNIKFLTTNLLQPIRNKLKKEILILSGYRCKELNVKVGGVHNSQHMEGEAADIICKEITTLELYNFIKGKFEYDQLILEHFDSSNPKSGWVHISYKNGKNRKMSFEIKKNNESFI